MTLFHQLTRISAICAFLLAGCMEDEAPPPAPPPPTVSGPPAPQPGICHEPRSEMCMMIYQPVCGQSKDGTWSTYPNSCQACTHSDVTNYKPGACK